jgi:hypothetical protein
MEMTKLPLEVVTLTYIEILKYSLEIMLVLLVLVLGKFALRLLTLYLVLLTLVKWAISPYSSLATIWVLKLNYLLVS